MAISTLTGRLLRTLDTLDPGHIGPKNVSPKYRSLWTWVLYSCVPIGHFQSFNTVGGPCAHQVNGAPVKVPKGAEERGTKRRPSPTD